MRLHEAIAHRVRGRRPVWRCIAPLLMAAALAGGCRRDTAADSAVDPANELPFGRVDAPVDGALVPSQTIVGGWAMDDRGIREVRMFVDGRFANSVQLNTDRADVSKAFATFARGTDRHGWTTQVRFEKAGPHSLVVQAIDTNGATRDIGALAVTSQ